MGGIAKVEFERTEDLILFLEPFIIPNLSGSGSRIESGDSITATWVAPDASTGTVTVTRNATTKIWQGTIKTAAQFTNLLAGYWTIRAVSDGGTTGTSPDIQYKVLTWGIGATDDVSTLLNTTLPEIATETDNIAGIQTTVNSINTTVGTINTNVSEVATDTDTIITTTNAIKAKTDNLPTSPASTSDVTTAEGVINTNIAAVQTTANEIATDTDTLITNVAAVQTTANSINAKTTNLPSDPASQATTLSEINAAAATIESVIEGSGGNTILTVVTAVSGVQTTANAIKAKTDNLPAVPAAQSDVTTVGTAVAAVQTTANTINTNVLEIQPEADNIAAIKAKTDNLPATPAAQSDVTAVTTILGMPELLTFAADIKNLRKFLTNHRHLDASANTLTVFDDNGTTPLKVFNLKNPAGGPPVITATDVGELIPQ